MTLMASVRLDQLMYGLRGLLLLRCQEPAHLGHALGVLVVFEPVAVVECLAVLVLQPLFDPRPGRGLQVVMLAAEL